MCRAVTDGHSNAATNEHTHLAPTFLYLSLMRANFLINMILTRLYTLFTCILLAMPPPQCQCQTFVISLPRHSPTFVHIRKKKDLSSSNFFGSNSFQDKKGLRKVWHNFAYKSFACVLARVEISRSLNCITFFPELFSLLSSPLTNQNILKTYR